MTVQIPVSFNLGEFPVRIKGVELHIVISEPAADAVGEGSETITETSFWEFVHVLPLNISQRKVYLPLINPEIGELFRFGEGRFAVLGPLI